MIHVAVSTDSMDILHISGVSGHNATTLHDLQDWRGRNHHLSLPVQSGSIQGTIPLQLGLAILHGGVLRLDCNCGWSCTDTPILRLLLFICH